ncbi:hypothetical protein ACFL5Y_03155, partial [Candidatus Omnitrophota bacterium]
MTNHKNRYRIWIKIIAVVVASLFFVNNIASALGPGIASNSMGDEFRPGTKKDMYTLARELRTVKKDLAIDFDSYKPGEFIGTAPKTEGIDFIDARYEALPEDWGNKALLEKRDLIEAFEYIRDHQAKPSASELDIRVEYSEADDATDKLPIARIEDHGGKSVLIINKKFLRMWNHIRANDVWFRTEIAGQKRTISVAWEIFYRLVDHLKSISDGRLNMLPGELSVNKNEGAANAIGGKYAHLNDAVWLWFLASYSLGNAARYNNDILEAHLEGLFRDTEEGTAQEALAGEIPHLKTAPENIITTSMDLICAINYHFFSRKGIEVPELTVPPKPESPSMAKKKRAKKKRDDGEEEEKKPEIKKLEDILNANYLGWQNYDNAAKGLVDIARNEPDLGQQAIQALVSALTREGLEETAYDAVAYALFHIDRTEAYLQQAIQTLESVLIQKGLESDAYRKTAVAFANIANYIPKHFHNPDFIQPSTLKALESVLTREGLGSDAYRAAADALSNIARKTPDLSQQAIQVLESVLTREGLESGVYYAVAWALLSNIARNSKPDIIQQAVQTLESTLTREGLGSDAYNDASNAFTNIAKYRPDLIQPSTVKALEFFLTREGLEIGDCFAAAIALGHIATNRPSLGRQVIQALESVLTWEGLDRLTYGAAANTLSYIAKDNPGLSRQAIQALESVLTRKGLAGTAYEAAAHALSNISKIRPGLFTEVYSFYKQLIEAGQKEQAQLLKQEIIKNLPKGIWPSSISKIKGEDWAIIIGGIANLPGFKLNRKELKELLLEPSGTKQSLLAITIKQRVYRESRAKKGIELKEYHIPQNNVPSYVGYYKQPWDVFSKFMDKNYDAFHKDPSAFNRGIAQQDLGKIDLSTVDPDDTKLTPKPESPSMAQKKSEDRDEKRKRLEHILTRKGLKRSAYEKAARALSNIALESHRLIQPSTIQALESALNREGLGNIAYQACAGALYIIAHRLPYLIQPSTVQTLESILNRKGLGNIAYKNTAMTLSFLAQHKPDLFAEVCSVYQRLIKGGKKEPAQLLKKAILENLSTIQGIPPSAIPKMEGILTIKDKDWPIIIGGIDDETDFTLSGEELSEILFEPSGTKQSLLAITIKQRVYRRLRKEEGVELKECKITQDNVPNYVGYYKQPWDVFCKFMDKNYDAFHTNPSAFNRDIAQQDLSTVDLGDMDSDDTKFPPKPESPSMAKKKRDDGKEIKRLKGTLTTKGLKHDDYEMAADALYDISLYNPDLSQQAVQALESVLTREGIENYSYMEAAEKLCNITLKRPGLSQPSTVQTLGSVLIRKGPRGDAYRNAIDVLSRIAKNRPDLFAEVYSVCKRLTKGDRNKEAQMLKLWITGNLSQKGIPPSAMSEIKGEDWPIILGGIDDSTGFTLKGKEPIEVLFEPSETKQSLIAITIKQKLYRKVRAKKGVKLKEHKIPQDNISSYVGYYKQPWDVFC